MNFYGNNKGTPDAGLIGVTERGDAGIDFTWADNIKQPQWAGAILITKRMSKQFNDLVLSCAKPVIVHCTCTGHGSTPIEPNAPDYKTQLDWLQDLIARGFPANRIVLRLDPIIPTPELLDKSEAILQYVANNQIPISRVRFSLMDQYPHVIHRLQQAGMKKFYPDINGKYQFHAPWSMRRATINMMNQYPFTYESCAEDWIATLNTTALSSAKFIIRGCVSETDLEIMGLQHQLQNVRENPQNSNGCHCLNIKGELLNNRKQCPHKCIYCYWKNNQ